MKNQMHLGLKLTTLAVAVLQAYSPAAVAQTTDQTVVVTGIRASARSSLAIKRDSNEVVDSITAEDIGKLPDPNVSETLTRIPGVQGYRYGGEGASPVGAGSGVTIRGLSGQTASHVNGRAYFTAGGRDFNIEGAIPAMIAGVDVYKNPSAEHIEGGIGGLVNIRTRNPSDFKGLTVSMSGNVRYNDLARKYDPELFGLVANRWTLADGSRIGVMAAATYQTSTGRSDNNPANGGANFKRAVRADSAEYATLAAGNTANAASLPQSRYVGRNDVTYLANVPELPTSATQGRYMPNLAGLTPAQIGNVMVAPALTSNVFQETISRERKGLNLAADWRLNNTLRFYADGNYTFYQYHQEYRGLNSVDGANVLNLQTTPFNYDEALANRNLNGGSNDLLLDKRVLSGSFLNSTVNTLGGNELRPFSTWVAATGVEWNPTPDLAIKLDYSYLKAKQTRDNRSVAAESAPGLFWTTDRVADGEPHQLNFSGPDLASPATYILRDYDNGNNERWDDSGQALALNGSYALDLGLLKRLKFGTRYAEQKSAYKNFRFLDRWLTTDGAAPNATRSNAINAGTYGITEASPTNFMRGDSGYAGGYVVYAPHKLTGDQVRELFPNAGILPGSSLAEVQLDRRYVVEKTKAIYLVGEFDAFDERLRGNVGVRYVRTDGNAVARVNDTTSGTGVLRGLERNISYSNTLPTFNLTYDITKDTLVRFGYGRGLSRPGLNELNPSVTVNTNEGTGTVGNPDLRPQVADSLDLSLEHYFSKTNYVAAAVFNKDIEGFFSTISQCQTVNVAPAYSGSFSNSCAAGEYRVNRTVNAESGYARGVELSGQYFFDSSTGWLKNYGLSASYTYVDTSNPINFGTVAAPRIVETPQPMQSKHNYSLSAMYEDNKMSARLVYTWRSPSVLFGVSALPIDGRYIGSYGILDGSFNYELTDNLTLSLNASNITDKVPVRYVGEPDNFETGLQRQHFANGRIFSVGLRFKFQ